MAALATIAALMVVAPDEARAADPEHVSFTLEGCRNDGSITLPDSGGKFICPTSAYTTGNLGKGWNELDLVPYRLTADAGNSAPVSQTYTIAVVLDNKDAGAKGYDVLSAPALNAGLSSAGCAAATVGGEQILTPGLGGIDESRYRLVTITQAKGKKCVYDFYGRLALGSHLFPGSSLHANAANESLSTAGIGARDVSIPVKEILPQELRKDMAASQGSDHIWDIRKGATPASLSFTDTCGTGAGARSQTVDIRIEWTKRTASPTGPITIITHVYAKNPASRVITVSVSDDIRSGTTVLDTASSGPVDVPADTELLVLTHQTTVPSGTANLNDVATATYTDKVTGVAVPGNTTATASASVQSSGVVTNASAVISDVESISGANLSYSVDSFTGASGSFQGGYVAGTITKNQVEWRSTSQSGSGSVTLHKTVYVDQPAVTTGTLADTATLNGSDGFTAQAQASVAIDASATVALTINKTIPVVLGAGDANQTFTFAVTGPGGYSSSPTITFGQGDGGSSSPKSVTLTGLAPGVYTVTEQTLAPYAPQAPRLVTVDLPSCAGATRIDNGFGPATARARKVTVPAGSEAGWDLTLNGPGAPAGGETLTTTGTGYLDFTTVLQEGAYTITETPKPGFDPTGASAECSFTVNYPADADRVFSCTITNTQRGSLTIVKDAVPDDPQDFAYTTTGTGLAPFSLDDDPGNGDLPDTKTFTNLVPGAYTVTETLPVAGWDLTGMGCSSTNGASTVNVSLTTGVASVTLGAGDSVTCRYRNTKRGRVTVLKTENGAAPTTAYTFRLTGGPDNVDLTRTTDGTNLGSLDFGLLRPGTYTLCELAVPAGTHSTLEDLGGTVDAATGNVCLTFTLAAGETRAFTIDNSHPGGGQRTIGYWKNWNSCSGTGNNRVAMAAKTGNHLLDEFLPQSLGGYAVDTCAKGVTVLTSASGKFAENQMAAQLLAAKLNLAAGASTCASVNTAIAHADALLTGIGYAGPPSSKVGPNHAQRADVLATSGLLDDYNNGLVC